MFMYTALYKIHYYYYHLYQSQLHLYTSQLPTLFLLFLNSNFKAQCFKVILSRYGFLRTSYRSLMNTALVSGLSSTVNASKPDAPSLSTSENVIKIIMRQILKYSAVTAKEVRYRTKYYSNKL